MFKSTEDTDKSFPEWWEPSTCAIALNSSHKGRGVKFKDVLVYFTDSVLENEIIFFRRNFLNYEDDYKV